MNKIFTIIPAVIILTLTAVAAYGQQEDDLGFKGVRKVHEDAVRH